MSRALIIDDEPPACDILRELLGEHPRVEVVGEAGTMEEARTRLAEADYDLVFLDVQLIGGTGFDLVPHVRPGAAIVFVTAYDRHAFRAFSVNALDYLLKPVDPERLAETMRRVSAAASSTRATSTPAPALPTLTLEDRVLLRLGAGGERMVTVAEIRSISACENYTTVVLSGDTKLFVRRSMKSWEEQLPPEHFARSHRQAIVNLRHVGRIERVSISSFLLHIAGLPDPVRASYRYVAALRAKLKASPPA